MKYVKHEFKVYQASTDCPWAFMNKDFANSHGFYEDGAFEKYYTEVANSEVLNDEYDENYQTNVLNEIFHQGNNGELQSKFKMRSISVSDIIKFENKYFYVNDFGFVQL